MKITLFKVFENEEDLAIMDGQNDTLEDIFFINNPRFIRVEVLPQVLKNYYGLELIASSKVAIKGRLKWDRDGFLEIHPTSGRDIEVI
jgi:hypothetical protein